MLTRALQIARCIHFTRFTVHAFQVAGKPPSLVPIYGGTFSNGTDSKFGGQGPARDGYVNTQKEFIASFCDPSNSCLCYDSCAVEDGNGRPVNINTPLATAANVLADDWG